MNAYCLTDLHERFHHTTVIQIITNYRSIKKFGCLYAVLFVGISRGASLKLMFQVPEGYC